MARLFVGALFLTAMIVAPNTAFGQVVKSSAEKLGTIDKKTTLLKLAPGLVNDVREIHIHKGSEIRVEKGLDEAKVRDSHKGKAWIYIRFKDGSGAVLQLDMSEANITRLLELSQARREALAGIVPFVGKGTMGPDSPSSRHLISNGFRVGNIFRLFAALGRYDLDPTAITIRPANRIDRTAAYIESKITNGGATAIDEAAAKVIPDIPNVRDAAPSPFIDRIKDAGKGPDRSKSVPPRSTHVPKGLNPPPPAKRP